jgi:hypothetical protein
MRVVRIEQVAAYFRNSTRTPIEGRAVQITPIGICMVCQIYREPPIPIKAAVNKYHRLQKRVPAFGGRRL